MDSRRVLLMREPIGDCAPDLVARDLAALGTIAGLKIDDAADVAYIAIETTASDYALTGAAPVWSIWRGQEQIKG